MRSYRRSRNDNAMVYEPFFSPRRLVSAWQIAAMGALALIGIRSIWIAVPVYVDAAYRVVCLAGAVCTAWWMYRPGGPSKPWLPQEKTRLLAFWIEAGSVIVAVSVLAALVVLLIEWWFIR